MDICTIEEIFDFMGTEEDLRVKKNKFIQFLIKTVSKNLENILGRKIEKKIFTDIILKDNINCEFYNNKIYFKNEYRDIYEITELTLNGKKFVNYFLDKNSGCLIFEEQINFINNIIKITGHLGLLDENEEILSELKFAAMELVAVKSRLWTRNIYTLEGTVKTLVLDISEETKDIINKYILKSF